METLDALMREEKDKDWSAMGLLLGFVLLFVIVLMILFSASVGVAFLLPAVGLEMALLVGAVVVGQTLLIFARLASAPSRSADEAEGDYERAPIVILDREVALPRRRRHRT